MELIPQLDEADLEIRLRHMLVYNDEPHQFTLAETQSLITAIDQVKVIDPAVGSGAFPMGILHKLVHLLSRLDPHNMSWKERQVQKASDIPDSEIRRQVLDDIQQAFECNELDYGRKLYLIENCIYGVDIQPIAVQIAKLRFFISLVVDQRIDDTLPNRGIRPLPNLETRFVAADSLLSLERHRAAVNETKAAESAWPEDSQLQRLGRDLLSILEQYRKVQAEVVRARYRRFCEETVTDINQRLETLGATQRLEASALLAKADFNLEIAARELPGYQSPQVAKALVLRSSEVEQKENELAEVRRRYFTARTFQTKEKYRQRDDEIRAELAELLRKTEQLAPEVSHKLAEWSPYEQNRAADFFDPEWMFGVVQGFDIVLGNPPYVRQEQIKELKPALQERYSCYTGTADLYVYFYERGIQLLRPGGVLTYISSNKYFRSGYGEKLRRYLGEKLTIRQVIDFGDAPVFTAISYPSIIVAVKTPNLSNQVRALTWELGKPIETFAETFKAGSFDVSQKELVSVGWRLERNDVLQLIAKLQQVGKPLGEYDSGKLYRGIITGLNEAMVVDLTTRDRLVSEDLSSAEILKPLLRGRDVKRWRINFSDQYLIKIESSENRIHTWTGKPEAEAEQIFAQTYPAIYYHLQNHRTALIKREDQGKYFWELRSCTYWSEFEKPKIIYPNICQRNEFAWDSEKYLTNQKAFIIPDATPYLLGILNSKVVMWLFVKLLAKLQGGFFEPSLIFLSEFPIPDVQSEQQARITALVEQILATKRADPTADVSNLETEIDQLVYRLYGLTEEETDIVEGR